MEGYILLIWEVVVVEIVFNYYFNEISLGNWPSCSRPFMAQNPKAKSQSPLQSRKAPELEESTRSKTAVVRVSFGPPGKQL